MQKFERPVFSELPPNRPVRAIIIGVIAGILCAAESVIITLTNSSIYQQASSASADKVPVNIATTILGLTCLTFFISLLIYLIAGYVTGKVVVERRMGFLAGFVAGAITYGISFLKSYIPSYPGNLPTSGTANAAAATGGIVLSLIFLIAYGVIGGLVGLLGARLATRRHPHYVGYAEEPL